MRLGQVNRPVGLVQCTNLAIYIEVPNPAYAIANNAHNYFRQPLPAVVDPANQTDPHANLAELSPPHTDLSAEEPRMRGHTRQAVPDRGSFNECHKLFAPAPETRAFMRFSKAVL